MRSVLLMRNSDRRVVEIKETEAWAWPENWVWMWTEGNYSCDCNRELEFRRALGETPEWDDVECSEGRFSVWIREGNCG